MNFFIKENIFYFSQHSPSLSLCSNTLLQNTCYKVFQQFPHQKLCRWSSSTRRGRRKGRDYLSGSRILIYSTLAAMASVLLLFLVFVFDLTAFGLAVAAEQRRTTVGPLYLSLVNMIWLLLLLSILFKCYLWFLYCVLPDICLCCLLVIVASC